MRFVLFNGGRLGLVREDWIRDLTSILECYPVEEPTALMLALIQQWDSIRSKLDNRALSNLPKVAVNGARLDPPLPLPGKIVAAPINYLDHKQEMDVKGTVAQLGVFLKANSSVIGPDGIIEIPYNDRRIDQEGELALVIGKTARKVSAANALDYVFGYTCLLDITVRGQEDRSTRKSFDTFTPIGPGITTIGSLLLVDIEVETLSAEHSLKQPS